MPSQAAPNLRRVRGVVAPASWDDDEQVGAIAIWTDEEEEILVAEDSDVDLWPFLRTEVEAEGDLRENPPGPKSMAVRRVTPKQRAPEESEF